MEKGRSMRLEQAIFHGLRRSLWLAAAIFLFFRFADNLILLLLFFLLSAVLAIAMAPPVNWLEDRKVPRPLGTILVLLLIGGLTVGIGAMVFPRVADDAARLANDLPTYIASVADRAELLLDDYPAVRENLDDPELVSRASAAASGFLMRIGRTTIDVFIGILAFLVLISIVGYSVANPRPLLKGIVTALPEKHRDKFANAFAQSSDGVISWVWANVIIGLIEGVAAAIFLSILGVPGALAFGAFTFFAELIPQLGGYLMAVPPALVSLAIDPMMAVWVVVFYIVLQNVVNTALAPLIHSRTMKIHPVSEIFVVLALTILYGFIGAIVSAPVVAILKAFYNEFYGSRHPEDDATDDRVERMLRREQSDSDGAYAT